MPSDTPHFHHGRKQKQWDVAHDRLRTVQIEIWDRLRIAGFLRDPRNGKLYELGICPSCGTSVARESDEKRRIEMVAWVAHWLAEAVRVDDSEIFPTGLSKLS